MIWRGGRPFKSESQIKSDHQNANGEGKRRTASMGTDENISGSATDMSMIDLSLFENEKQEVDPAKPYHPIVQDLNLPLGTAALHIALPSMAHAEQNLPSDVSPILLKQNIVIAMACADSITRLLILPLMPPSPQSKNRPELRVDVLLGDAGRGSWGEILVKIPRTAGNQGLPKAVSLAFMPRTTPLKVEDNTEEGEDAITDQDETGLYDVNEEWDILLALCGSDRSSEISMYKIPLWGNGAHIESDAPDEDLLWRSEPLVRSVAALELYIPSESRSHEGPYLLLAETNGTVRIYDCCIDSDQNRGRWIRWFNTGFEDDTQGDVRYRTLLDAKWILGGRAIAVLMADGEWGAWKIDLNRPTGLETSGQQAGYFSGVPTPFTIGGWVGAFPSVNNAAKSSTGKVDSRSKLAPMTPSTRKIRESALFTRSITRSSFSTQGGVSTCVIAKALSTKEDDETLVLWHGEKIIIIPSLLTHWQTKIKGTSNLFSIGATGQAREVGLVDLGGELRNSVSILPPDYGNLAFGKPTKQPDLLISGNRSLCILATPLDEPRISTTRYYEAARTQADQRRLSRGELDLNGMDRLLDDMRETQYVTSDLVKRPAVKRKVVFAQ